MTPSFLTRGPFPPYEKVSLGVVLAVLVTCMPLANARTCHSYTDCYLRLVRVPLPVPSLLDDHLSGLLAFPRLALAAYTQSEFEEAIRSIVL